ncbi:unnamed protein product [Alternaria alternata]
MNPFASSSSHEPIAAETSSTSDQSPLPRLDGIIPEESGDEKGGEQPDIVEAGFLGQISEAQWLQNLRSRTQAVETVLVDSGDSATQLSHAPSPIFDALPTPMSASPLQQISPTNFYLDDEDIKLTNCGNPFDLPQEHTAALLFQCYARTIQGSFPILPVTIEQELHQYYTLLHTGQAIHYPQRWFALVNLVFAIGAKFSHLIQADWRAEDLDHVVYSSRAFHLLIMQALTVLMIAISCPGHFRDSLPVSCHSVRQLVSFLRGMRETNTLAARAYQFIYSIVKTSKPFTWDDVADAFPDEDIIVLQQPAAGRVDPKYSPWPDNDQPVEALFKYEVDGFGAYHFQVL